MVFSLKSTSTQKLQKCIWERVCSYVTSLKWVCLKLKSTVTDVLSE